MTSQPQEGKSMDDELESRLDELFGKEDSAEITGSAPKVADGPMSELKSAVLSIDWEISDEGLDHFLSQIKRVRKSAGEDKVVLMILQVLGALGDYIKSNRGQAHPKTFKILNSVFAGLEKVFPDAGLTEGEKKKILGAELKKYKDLRTLIQKSKSRSIKKPATAPAPRPPASGARPVPQPRSEEGAITLADEVLTARMLARAVEELKAFVHGEIEALRSELKRRR